MKYLEHYRELLIMIDVYEELYRSYDVAFYSLANKINNTQGIKSISYSGLPNGNYSTSPAEVEIQRLIDLKYLGEELKDTLEILKEGKLRIDNLISKLEGNKNKVAYMKFIQGYSNGDISKALGLSTGRINNIVTEIKKEM